MKKENCWEFFKCGGSSTRSTLKDSGICPVKTFTDSDGFGGGKNGGRGCLYITGTLCWSEIQGAYKEKKKNVSNVISIIF